MLSTYRPKSAAERWGVRATSRLTNTKPGPVVRTTGPPPGCGQTWGAPRRSQPKTPLPAARQLRQGLAEAHAKLRA